MNKNTSITLGGHFEEFIRNALQQGRYKNASEVIRAGLRLLEEEEGKVIALKNAIQEGVDSGIDTEFDPEKHIKALKAKRE